MRNVIAVMAFLALPSVAAAHVQQHFFPSRPPGATTHVMTGVLADYGIGNDTGGFTLARGSNVAEFAVGYPFTINGITYRCLPNPTRTHDQGDCKRWPRNLIVGKSRVSVTYWWQRETGVGLVRASDSISVVTMRH